MVACHTSFVLLDGIYECGLGIYYCSKSYSHPLKGNQWCRHANDLLIRLLIWWIITILLYLRRRITSTSDIHRIFHDMSHNGQLDHVKKLMYDENQFILNK